MISGAFKSGVQSLKPGDRVRETSTATGFIADYIVLIATCPGGNDTFYKLYNTYTNRGSRRGGCNQMPGSTVFISESADLFENKSVRWTKI